MDPLALKGIVLSCLFLLTFLFSMLPLKLIFKLRGSVDPVEQVSYSQIISLLSCFAGGVFMAAGLLDIFPEVKESFQKIAPNTPFPIAEFTVAFGFFVVLALDLIVLDYKEQSRETQRSIEILVADDLEQERRQLRRRANLEQGNSQESEPNRIPANAEPEPHSSVRSALLVFALSLHSLFEGLSIGLQPDINSVLQISLAVFLHKAVIAFSLGLNLVQSDFRLISVIRSNFIFSCMSPIGVGIGMCLLQLGRDLKSSVANAVLQGLACGTYIYVTFFEVLPHELNQPKDRLLKLVAVIVGFSLVCSVLFLDPGTNKAT
uniref:Zinc transporter ZIP1 n=1 Tax=Timema cristinae TaxID=61476 RepID=A0A7R9DGP6_TIMCR|nr:unnamed protein product [Timema cristinae]